MARKLGDLTDKDRSNILTMYLSDKPVFDICDIFDIPSSTLYRLLRSTGVKRDRRKRSAVNRSCAPHRCPTCGSLITTVLCLSCNCVESRITPADDDEPVDFSPHLTPDQHARYLHVRRQAIARGC